MRLPILLLVCQVEVYHIAVSLINLFNGSEKMVWFEVEPTETVTTTYTQHMEGFAERKASAEFHRNIHYLQIYRKGTFKIFKLEME